MNEIQCLADMNAHVEITPDKLGGTPVLSGTRFSVSQLFAELAESKAVYEIAQDFSLDPGQLQECLHAFAVLYDQPWAERKDP